MQTKYTWTNHALTRLKERKIPKAFIEWTLSSPDRKIITKDKSIEFQKRIDVRTVAIIVKMNEHREHIIVSVWINPPFPGTKDYKKRQRYLEKQKASFLKKFWLTLLDILGL